MMIRRAVALLVAFFAFAGLAQATPNPARYAGKPMSCPDPDAFAYHGAYAAACTSDFGQDNPILGTSRMGRTPDAFPIYTSPDLVHWTPKAFIVTPRDCPRVLACPAGDWPGGEYWSPEVHLVGGWWVAVFAAQLRATRQWVIVQAWTKNILSSQWGMKVLYRAADGSASIDPTMAPDRARPGRWLLAFRQADGGEIVAADVSTPVIGIVTPLREVSHADLSWECSNGGCVEEGPVLWDEPGGPVFLFFNGGSTWNDSYAVGVSESLDPLSVPFVKRPSPILRSGNGMVSTGIGVQPFPGPRGWMVSFHVQLGHAVKSFEGRWLAFAPLRFASGWPFVAGGVPPRSW